MNNSRRLGPLLAWLAVMALAGLILLDRLHFSYDLALFLPAASAPEQQVLLERLGDAPGSRFLLIGIPDRFQQERDVIGELSEQIADSPLFSRVLTDASSGDTDSVPEPVWTYRYLLTDVALDALGLAQTLGQRRTELTLMAGGPLTGLIQSDPHLASLNILEPFAGSGNSTWRSADGAHLLIAETVAAAFDLIGQEAAVNFIDHTLFELGVTNPVLSGVGVFGVGVRDTISREAKLRSIAASVALALVLLLTYRQLTPLWLAALPLLTGMVLGLTAVAAGFGQVHGITLAFGFTLMGIALDYPLHLISAARAQPAFVAARNIWPTLRLGAASTALAYLAIALGGSQGLAQLGVFSLVGVIAAALTTRWLLPVLMFEKTPGTSSGETPGLKSPVRGSNNDPQRQATMSWLAVPALLMGGLGATAITWQGQFWDNNLSAMSPVPAALIERDGELRRALGTPDLSRQIMLRSADLEALLTRSATLHFAMEDAVSLGLVGHYQSVSNLLSDRATQTARQARLPNRQTLSQNLNAAVRDLPFNPAAFESFIQAVTDSHQLSPLTPEGFTHTPLQSLLGQFLYSADDEWVSLVALYPPIDVEGLAGWLANVDKQAKVIDLKRASQTLVADYRSRTFLVLGGALTVIGGLLLWRLPGRRATWCVATVLSVLVACAGLNYAFSGPLNLYHLMALLLVAGLGLDYALFLSRRAGTIIDGHARHAVTACAASTAITFAVLALSDIPALSAMGGTVAVGTSLAFAATWVTTR